MQALNFPSYTFRIQTKGSKEVIFDPVRKRMVALTPEEWVRQHLIQLLVNEMHVPLHMIACERGLEVNRMQKRFDVVVFKPDGLPALLIECKAPHVAISEETFYQIAGYNLSLRVHYLFMTNGLNHICGKIDYTTGKLVFLEKIPDYKDLCK